ncbi:MAG: NADH-quinone oxidoreductase subunit N [Oligoflexia bacterium]
MKEFGLLLPEIYLAATVMGLVLSESAHHGERVRLILPTALLGLGGAFFQALLSYQQGASLLFGGSLSLDGFALFFKLFFLVMAALGITAVCLSEEIEGEIRSEFAALTLVGTVALMIAAESTNLFVSALALQAAGAVGYLLAGFGRKSPAATEAAIKWMGFSMVSGALLFLGAIALFLQSGTANIQEIHQQLVATPPSPQLSLLVFAVIFIGLSAPMMIFPAQFFGPDFLQGSPSVGGAYLLAGLRAGAFAVAARIWVTLFAQPATHPGKWLPLGGWDWTRWVAVSAGLSMMMPALLALRQSNAKRLLGCVALVQGGFLLLGLLVLEQLGLAAILFSLLVELISLVGVFYVLSLGVVRRGSSELEKLRGVLRGRPWETVALLCFAVSWLGLPPFAGSVGRFALLGAAVRREWYVLALVGLLAMTLTIVAAGRLLLVLILSEGESCDKVETSQVSKIFLLALLIPLFGAAFFAEPLLRWASLSLRFIFW